MATTASRWPGFVPKLPTFAKVMGPTLTQTLRPYYITFEITPAAFLLPGHDNLPARRFGYEVVISNSRGPETLAGLVAQLGPRARSARPAAAGDFAAVTVPLKSIGDIPVEPLAGKIVIDTNNYYWERDGRFPALDNGEETTSGLLQKLLPTSKSPRASTTSPGMAGEASRRPRTRWPGHGHRDGRAPRPHLPLRELLGVVLGTSEFFCRGRPGGRLVCADPVDGLGDFVFCQTPNAQVEDQLRSVVFGQNETPPLWLVADKDGVSHLCTPRDLNPEPID